MAFRNATHVELQAKITKLRQKMKYLQEIKAQFQARPDGHLSLTDPDARAMTSHSMKGTAMVANTKPFTERAREPWRKGGDEATVRLLQVP